MAYFWRGTDLMGAAQQQLMSYGGSSVPADVKLLLRFDSGPSPFIDSSSFARTVTTVNTTSRDTTNVKYGAGSMRTVGIGNVSGGVTVPSSTDFDIATGDFTIETWLRIATLPTSTFAFNMVFHRGDLGYYLMLNRTGGGVQEFYCSGASGGFSVAHGMVINTWYHIALVRDGSTYRIYKDGVQLTSSTGVTFANLAGALAIGGSNANTNFSHCNFDDFRFTKGTCRYPSGTTFTPPGAL